MSTCMASPNAEAGRGWILESPGRDQMKVQRERYVSVFPREQNNNRGGESYHGPIQFNVRRGFLIFKVIYQQTVHPRERAGLCFVLIQKILDTSTGHLQVGAGLVISTLPLATPDFEPYSCETKQLSFIGIIL